jgi:hypothetical protein
MSTTQINALQSMTPIVLDLDGNGIQTTEAAHGVQFDLAGNGVKQQFGWVGGKDGLLAIDLNGDGKINDGRELFGAGTVLANGQRAGNGYAALAEQDTNHDGKITAADANFSKLKVWVDANHDGKTDAGELKGLVELGVAEISLNFNVGSKVDHGNLQGLVGTWTGTDGTKHEAADVWFTKASTTNAPPKLGDLLAEAPAEMLGSAPGGGTVPPAPAPAHAAKDETHATTIMLPHRKPEDDTRNDILI